MDISKNPEASDLQELSKMVKSQPLKQLVFPVSLCENLDKEIYIPYRYFSELIVIEEFDDLPLTIQWLYVELAFGIRMLGNKNPAYKKLYEVQSEILRRVQYEGANARVTMVGTSISKKHLFRALELVGRSMAPVTIGTDLFYPVVGFSTNYKKDFLYPRIKELFGHDFLNRLKKTNTHLFLLPTGVIYLENKLIDIYPEFKDHLVKVAPLKEGHHEYTFSDGMKLSFNFLEV